MKTYLVEVMLADWIDYSEVSTLPIKAENSAEACDTLARLYGPESVRCGEVYRVR